MTREEISWYIIRLAATTSSICIVLVGWFYHYYKQEVNKKIKILTESFIEEETARQSIRLWSKTPIIVGTASFFLIIAGLLSIWLGYDSLRLIEWQISQKSLFFVAIFVPLLVGIIVFSLLWKEIYITINNLIMLFINNFNFFNKTIILINIEDSQSHNFDVNPDSARLNRWKRSYNILNKNLKKWALGKDFLNNSNNYKILMNCAYLAFDPFFNNKPLLPLIEQNHLQILETRVQFYISEVLFKSKVFSIQKIGRIEILTSSVCYLAYLEFIRSREIANEK